MPPFPLLDLLTALDLPWALVDVQGRVARWHPAFPPVARPDETPSLRAWFPQLPWPPEGKGPWAFALDPSRTLHLWLWSGEDAAYLAVLQKRSGLAILPTPGGKPFLNMMVHELRLPLTPIRGYGELLLQGMLGDLTPQQKQVLETIVHSVAHMNRLLTRLSLLGKIEAGTLPLSPQPLRPAVWLREKLQEHRPALEEAGLTLKTIWPETMAELRLDPTLLAHLLDSLLDNARLYTPAGGTVGVQAAVEARALYVEVWDTGPGVDEAERGFLFHPFFRGSAEHIRQHKGWGMDLYTAYRLARYMGGEIGYIPREGGGSRFWFRVPSMEDHL